MRKEPLAESEARPIIDIATARLAEGWAVLTRPVTVESTGTRRFASNLDRSSRRSSTRAGNSTPSTTRPVLVALRPPQMFASTCFSGAK